MKVLMIEPGKKPRKAEIDGSLEGMQKVVGGYIQAIYPFEDPVVLICNEEGKLLELPFNRALRDEDGDIYDIVAGTFFLCSAPPDSDSFEDLSDELMEKYSQRFSYAEMFLEVDGKIVCLRQFVIDA